MTVHQLCVAVNVVHLQLIEKHFADIRQVYGLHSNHSLRTVVALRKAMSPKCIPYGLKVFI